MDGGSVKGTSFVGRHLHVVLPLDCGEGEFSSPARVGKVSRLFNSQVIVLQADKIIQFFRISTYDVRSCSQLFPCLELLSPRDLGAPDPHRPVRKLHSFPSSASPSCISSGIWEKR